MRALAGLAVLGLTLALAGAAQAATVLGQASPDSGSPSGCISTQVEWIQERVSGGTPYGVPGPGVITSWTTLADIAGGSSDEGDRVAFRVYSRGTGDIFTPLAESDAVTLDVPFLHTSPTRIPVRGGEFIGVRIVSSGGDNLNTCRRGGAPLDIVVDHALVQSVNPIPIGQAAEYGVDFFGSRIDLSAKLEPDADGDGFGDETQDGCTFQATGGAGCDLSTTISSKPKSKTKSRKAKFEFSGAGGVTFQCRLDKKDFTPCESPKTIKKLKPRKHTFRIQALDPGGNPGEEAVARWRVTGG